MEEYIETTGTPESPEPPKPSTAQVVVKEIVSWIMCIAIAFAVALVLRNYIFTFVKVDGQSMCPTLQHNQRLFTRIIGYTPERGDIIIFNPKSHPDIAYVKRVIATEGDRIWIDDSNGSVHLLKKGSTEWEALDEPYIADEAYNSLIPNIAQRFTPGSDEEGLLIEEDHIFVMGDNRNHSNDSRNDFSTSAVGQVHVDNVIGKAEFRWWPIADFGSLY